MHPDRRRRGRAIRKERRLNRTRPSTNQLFRVIGASAGFVALQLQAFGEAIAAAVRLDTAHARFAQIARHYAPTPITFESRDMTTIVITAPSTAPWPLLNQLDSFARDLHNEGIDVGIDIIRTCTICGCTDDHACLGGCAWINQADDLCTTCDAPTNRTLLEQLKTERTTSLTFATALAAAAETNGDDE